MRMMLIFRAAALALLAFGAVAISPAQEAAAPKAAAKPSPFSSLVGEVMAIEAGGKEIALKTDAGAGATTPVKLDDKTHFMKVAPGEKDLKKATDVQFSEIGVGDRVLARVRKLEDGSVSAATTVVVMTKAAIAQHQERNAAEWQARGVVGTVSVVNLATKEVTLKMQGADAKQVMVEPSDKVNVRKYAPGSVKFSETMPSTIAEIKVGDTIRVLGTKNEDGSRVVPEEIVFGSFVRQAATILAIDTAAGIVKMMDLTTKKPVTVKVEAATTIKRLPPMVAAMMAGGGRPGGTGAPGSGPGAGGPGGGGAGTPGAGAGRPSGGPPEGARSGQGRPAGAEMQAGAPGGANPRGPGSMGPGSMGPGGPGDRKFDPVRMLERLPALTLADLKPGDAVIVSSSGSTDPALITAISLVAGVEPLLTAPSKGGAAAGPSSSWNFEVSIPQ